MPNITYRPLTGWPWPITNDRGYSRFRVGYDTTKRELAAEICYQSGGDDIIIELDVADRDVRHDKQLRVGAKTRSPRVVVTFQDVHHGWVRYHADIFCEWRANVRCIRMTLEALRGIDRWGGQSGEQYAGFVVSRALTGEVMSMEEGVAYLLEMVDERREMQMGPVAPLCEVVDAKLLVREALKVAHPDYGGSAGELLAVQQIRDMLGNHHGESI